MKLKSTLLFIALSFLFACTPTENTSTTTETETEIPEAVTPIIEAVTPKPSFENSSWTSTDDPKSAIAIKDGKWSDVYDGEILSSGTYKVEDKDNGKQLTVTFGEEVYEYHIINHTETALEMSMIGGRGNTLNYKKD